MRALGLFLLAANVLTGPARAETRYPLSGENTTVGFVGSKPDGKHVGGFKKLSGTATAAGIDPTTLKLEVEIDVHSLYSDNFLLTLHLKGADFFDAKTHPKAKFVSTKIRKGDEGFVVTGDLTLCGKTKAISFPAQITLTEEALTLESAFTIDRTDFGMTYGKGKIDDAVALTVRVKARK